MGRGFNTQKFSMAEGKRWAATRMSPRLDVRRLSSSLLTRAELYQFVKKISSQFSHTESRIGYLAGARVNFFLGTVNRSRRLTGGPDRGQAYVPQANGMCE